MQNMKSASAVVVRGGEDEERRYTDRGKRDKHSIRPTSDSSRDREV